SAVDAWLVEWRTWAGGRVAWRVRLQRLAGLARRAWWAGRVVGQSGTGQAQGEESDYWSNHEGSAHEMFLLREAVAPAPVGQVAATPAATGPQRETAPCTP